MSFLTLEDVNGTVYSNQKFWWHTIRISDITSTDEDFSNIQYDFCEISRTKDSNNHYNYTITVYIH